VKGLLKIIDAIRPTFDEGGKLGILKPVFGALEHFFFAPSDTTIGAPHIGLLLFRMAFSGYGHCFLCIRPCC